MAKEPMLRSRMTKDGAEIPDPTPMALPVGFERPESIHEMIRRMVTDPRIRADLEGSELETFEEADDFDIPGDEPVSPHEDSFDPQHLLAREQEVMAGAVRPRTADEVLAAKKVLSDYRAELKAKKAAAQAAAAGAATTGTHT